MRRVWLIGLLSLAAASSIAAQQLEPEFVTWKPPAVLRSQAEPWDLNPADTLQIPQADYRYEGLAFGGIVFGGLGAWIGSRLGSICPTVPGAKCEADRLGNAVMLGLAGAALGGGLGYLVGRFSPKRPAIAKPAPDTLELLPEAARRPVGYHHWEGTAIGAGASALLIGLLYLVAPKACDDCGGGKSYLLEAELIAGGVGGALGFLIGLGVPKYGPAGTVGR